MNIFPSLDPLTRLSNIKIPVPITQVYVALLFYMILSVDTIIII